MSNKMIIEARVLRDENPHVPWTTDENAATASRCREEIKEEK